MARALYHQPLHSPHQPVAFGTETMLRLVRPVDFGERDTRSVGNLPPKEHMHRRLLLDSLSGESLVLGTPSSRSLEVWCQLRHCNENPVAPRGHAKRR